MSDPQVERCHAFLRANSTGDLRFDEHLRPVRYVVAADGRLVAPVMVAMLQSMDTVLFVPDCAENATEVQVTLEPFDEHGPDGGLCDRWRIYHGEPDDVRWARLDIDAARFEGAVIDGQALVRPNPLAPDEPQLCTEMNKRPGGMLHLLCLHLAGTRLKQPVMVGIDPLGVDVRGTFQVFRLPAPEPMNTPDDARRVLEMMCRAAQAAESEGRGHIVDSEGKDDE